MAPSSSSAASSSSGRSTPVRATRSAASGPAPVRGSSRLSTSTTTSSSSAGAPTVASTSSRLTAPTFASQARSVSPKKPTAASAGVLASASRLNLATPARLAGLKHSASTHRVGNAATERSGSASRVAENLSIVPNTAPIDLSSHDSSNGEAIQAFLRIRPGNVSEEDAQAEPYIQVVSEKEVLMVPPSDTGLPRSRAHAKQPSTRYTFAKVFPPAPSSSSASAQSAFFRETTLPMVYSLLQGECGLVFAYGVTNSGKSYTVVGGKESEEAGLIPRAMDVVFNSIDGLQSESDISPVGLYGVERANRASLGPAAIPTLSRKLSADTPRQSLSPLSFSRDSTKLKVDRNYRYSVWVSYVEVYNEKLFDLLDAGSSASATAAPSSPGGQGLGSGMTRSDSVRGSNWNLVSMASSSELSSLTNVNRRPLTLKADPEGNGKYVAGLQEIRVKSVIEARELLKKGQDNRVIFSTLANRTSSRSHGVFTIKIVREHGAGQADPDESLNCTVSRLSIVDLAGSERISNTDTTGERRKEAGNINKSLMCLGQCLETLRKNQARAAASIPTAHALSSTNTGNDMSGRSSLIPQPNSMNSKFKRRPSVVPFRHSKLTELFQPFFTGEGRTVMIVNANPYDTGFDENNHVMRFSAVAKEVQIVREPDSAGGNSSATSTIHRRLPAAKAVANTVAFPGTGTDSDVATPPGTPGRRPNGGLAAAKSRLGASASGSGIPSSPRSNRMAPPTPFSARSGSTAPPEISIIEEASSFATAADGSDAEDEDGDDDDDADSTDPFVDLLIARHEDLRIKLFEAEKRAREIEAEVREEMANEMAERLAEMERRYTERLLSDAESNEDFFNAKIDLLIRANSSEAQRLRSRLDAALLATPRPGAGPAGTSPRKQAPLSPLSARGDIFKTPLTGSAAMFKTPRLVLPGGAGSGVGGEDEEIEVESELATLAGDSTGVTLADGSYSQDDESMCRSVYLQPGPLRRGAQEQAQLVMDTSEDELITSRVRPDKRGHEQQSISIDEEEEEEEHDSEEEDSEEEETDSDPDATQEEDMKRKVTKEDLSFVADSEEDASMSTSGSDSSQGEEDEDEDESQSVEVIKRNAKKVGAVAGKKAAAPAAKSQPKARKSKASASLSTSTKTAAAAAKKPTARASGITPAPEAGKSMPLRPSRASRSNTSLSISSASPAKRARTTGGSAKGKGKGKVVEEDDEEDEEEEMVVLKDSPSKRKRLLHAKKSVNEEEMEVLAGA